MKAQTSAFTTRDGTRIAYTLHGDPAAKARVAMIHSLAMCADYWRLVAERLVAQGFCAVALDCRGHGGSD